MHGLKKSIANLSHASCDWVSLRQAVHPTQREPSPLDRSKKSVEMTSLQSLTASGIMRNPSWQITSLHSNVQLHTTPIQVFPDLEKDYGKKSDEDNLSSTQ